MTNAANIEQSITPGCLVKLADRKAPLMVVGADDRGWTLQGATKDFYLTIEADGRALVASLGGRFPSFPRETRVESVIQ